MLFKWKELQHTTIVVYRLFPVIELLINLALFEVGCGLFGAVGVFVDDIVIKCQRPTVLFHVEMGLGFPKDSRRSEMGIREQIHNGLEFLDGNVIVALLVVGHGLPVKGIRSALRLEGVSATMGAGTADADGAA